VGTIPPSPLYDSLSTNLPHPIMAYSDYPFPPSTPLYPPARVVLRYLESYAARFNLHQLIEFNTTVQSAQWVSPTWRVHTSAGETVDFDFLIVANGHYAVPQYPDTPGLSEWLAMKTAIHSTSYRHPHGLGDVVLVVGNGHSGRDISAEASSVAKVVIHSITGAVPRDAGDLAIRGRVKEYKPHGQAVFEDGTIENGIDRCVLATGYAHFFPFFTDDIIRTDPRLLGPLLPDVLHNSRHHVFPLGLHMFPLQKRFPPTSMAFVGLVRDVSPFPAVEAQAFAIARVIAQSESLDVARETADTLSRYAILHSRYGGDPESIAKRWHRLDYQEYWAYMDRLFELANLDRKTPEWFKDVYRYRKEIRAFCQAPKRKEEAEAWVSGVGEAGGHEWIDLLKRLVKQAQEDERKT
jgi:cation diffusion facilitator CzcD-associated flavoprotein CzcO